jgi:SAM-dependent methyltransferase
MHPTALQNASFFSSQYLNKFTEGTILDLGSQDVNGSLKSVMPSSMKYIGVDFVPGRGVDVVLDDPYKLPFESESVDVVVSSSVFEHSEMFWLVFLEILRILKPHGLLYLNVPSNGTFHRYPVDCWRFYPDSGKALVTWSKRNGLNPLLVESYTSKQWMSQWNDYVAVFVKDEKHASDYKHRICDLHPSICNATVLGKKDFINLQLDPEDQSNSSFRFKNRIWTWKKSLMKRGWFGAKKDPFIFN